MTQAIFGLFSACLGAVVTLAVQWFGHRRSLHLLAAERRIQAHQDAFAVWWKLAVGYHDTKNRIEAARACQDFWNNNCLYLGRSSRKAFRETLVEIMFYDGMKDSPAKMIQLSNNIENVFRTLMADAAIPDVNESVVDVKKILSRLRSPNPPEAQSGT